MQRRLPASGAGRPAEAGGGGQGRRAAEPSSIPLKNCGSRKRTGSSPPGQRAACSLGVHHDWTTIDVLLAAPRPRVPMLPAWSPCPRQMPLRSAPSSSSMVSSNCQRFPGIVDMSRQGSVRASSQAGSRCRFGGRKQLRPPDVLRRITLIPGSARRGCPLKNLWRTCTASPTSPRKAYICALLAPSGRWCRTRSAWRP